MKIKNKKAALFSIAASLLAITLDVILPGLSKANHEMQDFVKGFLTGMGGVVIVVWIVYLVRNAVKSYSVNGISILLGKDKNILLAQTMTLLLAASVTSIYFSNSVLISAGCFVIIAVSYALNFVYIKRMGRKNLCSN